MQLESLARAVVQESGLADNAVELTGSRVRIRIDITDATLAGADQGTREAKMTTVAAAVERALAAHADLAAVQVLSVGLIHPSGAGTWHVEDVTEFRRGPNGRFVLHGPT